MPVTGSVEKNKIFYWKWTPGSTWVDKDKLFHIVYLTFEVQIQSDSVFLEYG